MAEHNKEYGVINTYDPLRGFGFIRREKGKDVFFHYIDVIGGDEKISPGNAVCFSIEKAPKGLKAKNIEKLG